METKKVILIDLDDTLTNFVPAWCNELNKKHNTKCGRARAPLDSAGGPSRIFLFHLCAFSAGDTPDCFDHLGRKQKPLWASAR